MTVEKPTKIVNTTLYWPGERCDRCKRRVVVGYNIADKDWAAVTKDTNYTTLCLACFDELAQMKGVRYQTQTHNYIRSYGTIGITVNLKILNRRILIIRLPGRYTGAAIGV